VCEVLLQVPEVIRCVLLRMLEAVDGKLCLLEVLEVIRRVLCMFWRRWRVRSVCWSCLEAMRRVLLCILEAVEGELWLLEVLEVLEVMRCVLFCMLEAVDGWALSSVSGAFEISSGQNSREATAGVRRKIRAQRRKCAENKSTAG